MAARGVPGHLLRLLLPRRRRREGAFLLPAPGAWGRSRSSASSEATIISGRKLAAQVCVEIQRDLEDWLALGKKRPHLTVVVVGDNPASHTYVRNKVKAAAAVGIPTFGRNVVVAGRSKNVGMPISMLLHTDGGHERPGGDATVTITHRYTPKDQLKIHTQLADIIIVAAGIPKLITSDMVKEGAAVIDVGINHIQDPVTGKTKLVGDVDFEEVKKKVGFITPVPGGVGPMTVAMLLKNTLIAAKKLNH
ncbi:bifunctional methylenetetrahydrofolate dehydrogenase/cyclohydrolase 2, mitochondrial isoform X2 [Anolis sagrei]|uniref:bifunctional methylenetetrahydrofolate dehydrogenase/cyclohydrolase 2, mitochondrial isoform X2 n=1 Tax=Anolis sagrei TaxID=38937 RepID=UPI003521F0F6